MLRRALATQVLAAIALLMPLTVRAQLPDAPSAVRARMRSRGDFPAPLDSLYAARQPQSTITQSPQFALLNAEPGSGSRDSFGSAQQSIYKPSHQTLGPGPVSLTLPGVDVPGPAPVLYNACPRASCSLAESVMCCGRAPAPFARYLKNPDVVPITSWDNLHSAVKDIIDPFNLMTIAADSAFGIATDSHTPYGPGGRGIAKYAGVSMTEDLTGEFFGTYLVPSLTHQDPHYHREPFVSMRRRLLHTITQVVWTQSVTGRPMLNYANIVGGIATAVVSNTFVPGPGRQGWRNTSQRLALAFATSPSGNLIEEFIPDIASHINLRVVIFQRILNSVTLEEAGVQ